jgi:hypothetical protein
MPGVGHEVADRRVHINGEDAEKRFTGGATFFTFEEAVEVGL